MNALPVRRPLGCLKTVVRQARVQRQLRAYATETTPAAAQPAQQSPFRLCTSPLSQSAHSQSAHFRSPALLAVHPCQPPNSKS